MMDKALIDIQGQRPYTVSAAKGLSIRPDQSLTSGQVISRRRVASTHGRVSLLTPRVKGMQRTYGIGGPQA